MNFLFCACVALISLGSLPSVSAASSFVNQVCRELDDCNRAGNVECRFQRRKRSPQYPEIGRDRYCRCVQGYIPHSTIDLDKNECVIFRHQSLNRGYGEPCTYDECGGQFVCSHREQCDCPNQRPGFNPSNFQCELSTEKGKCFDVAFNAAKPEWKEFRFKRLVQGTGCESNLHCIEDVCICHAGTDHNWHPTVKRCVGSYVGEPCRSSANCYQGDGHFLQPGFFPVDCVSGACACSQYFPDRDVATKGCKQRFHDDACTTLTPPPNHPYVTSECELSMTCVKSRCQCSESNPLLDSTLRTCYPRPGYLWKCLQEGECRDAALRCLNGICNCPVNGEVFHDPHCGPVLIKQYDQDCDRDGRLSVCVEATPKLVCRHDGGVGHKCQCSSERRTADERALDVPLTWNETAKVCELKLKDDGEPCADPLECSADFCKVNDTMPTCGNPPASSGAYGPQHQGLKIMTAAFIALFKQPTISNMFK